MEESAEDDWSCSICLKLVLDPIVSACGHDFCRECLLRWAEQHASSLPVACPLCRAPIASNYQDVTRLGVCVRLRQAVEALFPAQLKRRREQQQHHHQLATREDGVHEGTAQRQAQALQQARRGRARYLRVRRSRAPILGGSPRTHAQPQDQPLEYTQHTQQQHTPQQAPNPLSFGGSSPNPPSPLLAHHPMLSPNLASGGGSGGSSSWSAELVPHFCIGWCEPVELRRGRRGRKTKSIRLRRPEDAR